MHHQPFVKYYFINSLDTNDIKKQDKRTVFIYRNYSFTSIDISKILKLKNYLRKKGHKFLLSNNIKLAIKLKLDGAYIPSFNNKMDHLSYSTDKNFIFLGSAHSLKEIRIKELQKVQNIFLSSIFKKNKNFLGFYKFKILSSYTKKEIIALGGITKKNVKKLNLLKSLSFAGISYFE
jgi:thiamine-phosphate pyrophosphorylase